MPEDPELETEKLSEAIHEELEKEGSGFLKRIALTTAVLAGFAAVAALQAGDTVNGPSFSRTNPPGSRPRPRTSGPITRPKGSRPPSRKRQGPPGKRQGSRFQGKFPSRSHATRPSRLESGRRPRRRRRSGTRNPPRPMSSWAGTTGLPTRWRCSRFPSPWAPWPP
jgi:hypothetical protein